MGNILIATPSLSDKATITGTIALGVNTIGNLKQRSLGRFYRTSQVCQINIDFGTSALIDFISLICHNGKGTVVIKAGTTDAVTNYTSSTFNLITGTDAGYSSNLFAQKITAQNFRYWRLEITNTGLDYFQVGRLYLDKSFQPIINATYGEAQGFTDVSRKFRTITGDISVVKRSPLKRVEFSLDFLNQEEMLSTLYDIDRIRGSSDDILYIKDLNENTYFQKQYIYGTFDELDLIAHEYFRIYKKRFLITELPCPF